jgi:hypothetical protein
VAVASASSSFTSPSSSSLLFRSFLAANPTAAATPAARGERQHVTGALPPDEEAERVRFLVDRDPGAACCVCIVLLVLLRREVLYV